MKGDNLNIRKLHQYVGLVFAPFFLITAFTGMVLLLRKTGIYGTNTKNLLLGFHNWEIAAPYIGAILAIGLIFMTVTGAIIFIKTKSLKH